MLDKNGKVMRFMLTSIVSWKKCLGSLAVFAVLSAVGCSGTQKARTYYVDSTLGNDSNNGLSTDRAWKSLERVNQVDFAPGDKLLFKAGTRYEGRLHPKGSGTAINPIVIDRYGEGEKPLVAAEGKFHEALLLENQEYWEVSNLQLTNTGAAREKFRYGVRVRAWDFGAMHHIHLKNLFVHDVNGSLIKKDRGEGHGIVWENGGERVRSWFDELQIEGCHLLRTDRNGICGHSYYASDRSKGWFPSVNVVVRNNLLEDIGGDGIKPWGCDGVLVEHNTIHGARTRCDDYAAGIWPWNCDNSVIQFNEVSGLKGAKDGEAFDSDGYCDNTLFQYNYSHDNEGGFMLICGKNKGTIIRYNISQNDHVRLFHMAGGPIEQIEIYNNVFYVGPKLDVHLFLWTGGPGNSPRDVAIRNNIFYVDGVGRNSNGLKRRRKPVYDGTYITQPGFGHAARIAFDHNALYGNFRDIPSQWPVMRMDPLLKAPGTGKDGFESVGGYQLRDRSPCIGAGVRIEDNGGRDFWGNPVPPDMNPSIGAYEKPVSGAGK